MTSKPPSPRTVSGLGPTPEPPSRSGLAAVSLSEQTYARTQDCVQCGLCLPVCPTYRVTGHEADSPRGRIRLMKGLSEARTQPTPASLDHLDLCLDCRSCETACPSNVVYHELLEETRAAIAEGRERGVPWAVKTQRPSERLVQTLIRHVLPYPRRLRFAVTAAAILRRLGLWQRLLNGPLGGLLPEPLGRLMRLLPDTPVQRSASDPTPSTHPRRPDPPGKTKALMFEGCVAAVLFAHLGRQSAAILRLAGCRTAACPSQVCCGAISHHNGRVEEAKAFARRNIDAFLSNDRLKSNASWIVNHVAGCGAMLKSYGRLLADDPAYATRAKLFSQKVRDFSELLVDLAPPPPTHRLPEGWSTVTIHDACHLFHAQRIQRQPAQLLAAIPGLEIRPLAEPQLCCGAAGTYNLTQPGMAAELAEQKLRQIEQTGARLCVSGNIGCSMHLQGQAQRLGGNLRVVHPIQLLHRAYFGNG